MTSMLVFHHFKCLSDTSEIGAESPYFLTFVADDRQRTVAGVALPVVTLTERSQWVHQVHAGDEVHVGLSLTSAFSLSAEHTLVLSAMVERDGARDISDDERLVIQNTMRNSWSQHLVGGFRAQDAGMVSNLSAAFQAAIQATLGKSDDACDDLMKNDQGRAVRRVPLTNALPPGQRFFEPVEFRGDGGRYRAWYSRQG